MTEICTLLHRTLSALTSFSYLVSYCSPICSLISSFSCWTLNTSGLCICSSLLGLPRWCSGNEFAYQCRGYRRHKKWGFDPWVRKILCIRKCQLQYSCLENSMNRRAWKATVHGVTKSWMWLSTMHLPAMLLPQYSKAHTHSFFRFLCSHLFREDLLSSCLVLQSFPTLNSTVYFLYSFLAFSFSLVLNHI